MSGYTGNPDAEAEHALILSENGVEASRKALEGSVLDNCMECGEAIAEARKSAARKFNMKCHFCIACQRTVDARGGPRIKMLDRIL